jgi:tetrahydromethanopterin S-methyltransferase subunit D
MNPLVDRRRRIWRSFAGVAVGIGVMLVPAAGATAGVAPAQGRFAGTTSQHLTTNDITFRVSRSAIQNRLIEWRAQCRSGGTLTGTTLAPRLPIVNGRWSSGGQRGLPTY